MMIVKREASLEGVIVLDLLLWREVSMMFFISNTNIKSYEDLNELVTDHNLYKQLFIKLNKKSL